MRCSSNHRRTPMCANPSAPPPSSATPMRRRDGFGGWSSAGAGVAWEAAAQDFVEQGRKRQEQVRERRLQFGTLRFSLTEKDSKDGALTWISRHYSAPYHDFGRLPDRAKLT